MRLATLLIVALRGVTTPSFCENTDERIDLHEARCAMGEGAYG